MKLHGRTDSNQREIVAALRAAGRHVLVLSAMGNGCPDLLAAWGGGHMILLEVKDGKKPLSAQKLTDAEAKFIRDYPGRVAVVRSVAEALQATGVKVQ